MISSHGNSDDSSFIICTDQDRLKQVLICLQSNAIKFTRQGGVTIQVSFQGDGNDRYVILNVVDTGVGIP